MPDFSKMTLIEKLESREWGEDQLNQRHAEAMQRLAVRQQIAREDRLLKLAELERAKRTLRGDDQADGPDVEPDVVLVLSLLDAATIVTADDEHARRLAKTWRRDPGFPKPLCRDPADRRNNAYQYAPIVTFLEKKYGAVFCRNHNVRQQLAEIAREIVQK
jgi:hypothetical protein